MYYLNLFRGITQTQYLSLGQKTINFALASLITITITMDGWFYLGSIYMRMGIQFDFHGAIFNLENTCRRHLQIKCQVGATPKSLRHTYNQIKSAQLCAAPLMMMATMMIMMMARTWRWLPLFDAMRRGLKFLKRCLMQGDFGGFACIELQILGRLF